MPLRSAVETEALLTRRPTERRFFDLEPTSDLVQKLYERQQEDRRLREQRRERSVWNSSLCWKVVAGIVGVAALVAIILGATLASGPADPPPPRRGLPRAG